MNWFKEWFYYSDVREFVKEAAKSFISNRERYTVYKNKEDCQAYLVFDNKHRVFYPFWVNSSKGMCEDQVNINCCRGWWYLQIVKDKGYSESDIHWTGFLYNKEQEYLYEKVYLPLYSKYVEDLSTKVDLSIKVFEHEMLTKFKEEK